MVNILMKKLLILCFILSFTGSANAAYVPLGANKLLGSITSTTSAGVALSVPSCSTSSSALLWTTAAGFSCNTSVVAGSVDAANITGTTLASGVTGSSLTSFGASIALGTPASGVATNLTGTASALNIGGNAATATTATTATNATNVATTSTATNASFFPLFVSSTANSNQSASLNSTLTYNPSTGLVSTTGLTVTGQSFNLDGVQGMKFCGTNTASIAIGNTANCVGTGSFSMGYQAMQFGGGNNNLAIGNQSLFKSGGANNVAIGSNTLDNANPGNNNVAIGYQALHSASSITNNTAIGYQVGSVTLMTGNNNILIGVDGTTDTAAGGTSNTVLIKGTGTAVLSATGTNGTPTITLGGPTSDNVAQLVDAAGTGLSKSSGTLSSNAVLFLDFQPGLMTSVLGTTSVFAKLSKASTVDNIIGSALSFSCVANPTVTMYECGTSATCVGPTTIGSVTITAAGTAIAGTVSNASVTAGDYVGWAITAGTCTSLDLAVTAQVHSN